MDYKELCCKIIDSHDGLVYVTDMETNEVIFVNKKLLQIIGKNKAEVFGKPCYQALQDKECPCEFCTNSILSENKYYDWEIFREDMQRYFVLHDKLLILGDRKFRVEAHLRPDQAGTGADGGETAGVGAASKKPCPQ